MALAWEQSLPPAAPIVDEYQLLSSVEAEQVRDYLVRFKQSTGIELSIYIPSSLQGNDISSFSLSVAEKWGLGKKGKDKGLLLLIAPVEKKMRLEVGYGLEGDIPDAVAKRILDQNLRPYFREGQYAEGIRAALYRLTELLQVDPEALGEEPERGVASGGFGYDEIVTILIFLFAAAHFVRSALGFSGRLPRGRRYGGGRGSSWGGASWGGGGSWGGGSSGGISWGGGGGGFGGGGASSDW